MDGESSLDGRTPLPEDPVLPSTIAVPTARRRSGHSERMAALAKHPPAATWRDSRIAAALISGTP